MTEAPRRATAEDLPGVGATLAAAFHDDPVMKWLVPSASARERSVRRFMTVRARQLLDQEEVWTVEGHAGAAVWAQPDRWHTTFGEVAGMTRALFPSILAHLPRSLRGLSRIEAAHPKAPPHYYLAILGTHPAHQGRGVGSRLLGPVLEDCDANGIGAYLESSKSSNLAFYSRHGFRATDEVHLPGGPPVWPMWRDPR